MALAATPGARAETVAGVTAGALSVIHRCAQTLAQDNVNGGVNLDAEDRFCLDGQRLIAISGA